MNLTLPAPLQDALAAARPYAPHLLVVGAFALAGIGVGVIQVNSKADLPEQRDRWALPAVAGAPSTPVSVDDVTGLFWTEQPRQSRRKTAAEPPKKVTPWTFVGTIDQGMQRVAVVATESNKILRLAPGDTLPDGAKVTDIVEGQLSFERDGASQTIKLFVEQKLQ